MLIHGQKSHPARSVKIALQSVKCQGIFLVLVGANLSYPIHELIPMLHLQGDVLMHLLANKSNYQIRVGPFGICTQETRTTDSGVG